MAKNSPCAHSIPYFVAPLQAMQNFMYGMLQDSSPVAAKMSLDVLIELYRKNIWSNTKTIQVIATACFSKTTKIMVAALKFFLGSEKRNEDGSDEDESSENDVRKCLEIFLRMMTIS